ncbi:MAG: 30S ribosomal protein S3 [Candidatus Bathyarchaeota archaeon]|nr:MAG: 30S ribosomal protein S3 [Candidatus Bathyarchaeota archaeon]
MSVVKRIIRDNIEKVKVDELLADEYEQAGYGGITLTKTPLGAQINLFAMRPGRVIGKRGRAIKAATERLEQELGLSNPQITVVEVEFPELNPQIMAARIANALERGVHYRRAVFWSLNRTMEAGALGCEVVIRGPLRSNRARYEKVSEGFVPKSGDPALKYVKKAVVHVKQKKGMFGINVTIVPPESRFPDKVSLDSLPVIEYPEEEVELPAGVEPEPPVAEEALAQIIEPETVPEETDAKDEVKESPAGDVEPQALEPDQEAEPEGSSTVDSVESEVSVEPKVEPEEPGTMDEVKEAPIVEVEPQAPEPDGTVEPEGSAEKDSASELVAPVEPEETTAPAPPEEEKEKEEPEAVESEDSTSAEEG